MRPQAKGFAFGLALGVAALAGFGAAQLRPGEVGQYQVTAAGTSTHRWVYLLDTRTGEVWERFDNGEFKTIPQAKEPGSR